MEPFNIHGTIIDEPAAARILKTTPSALSHMREAGMGPTYLKIGKRVRYYEQTIIEYAALREPRPDHYDRMLTSAEVAAWTGIAVQTLSEMRDRGEGPRSTWRERRVFYRLSEVEIWLFDCLRYARDEELTGPG